MTYDLHIEYEKNDHSIVERWHCKNLKKLKEKLGESLDITVDEKKIPKEPVYEDMYKNLNKYVDEKFIKSEFKRMKKNYLLYLEIIEDIEGMNDQNTYDIDKNTYVYVDTNK